MKPVIQKVTGRYGDCLVAATASVLDAQLECGAAFYTALCAAIDEHGPEAFLAPWLAPWPEYVVFCARHGRLPVWVPSPAEPAGIAVRIQRYAGHDGGPLHAVVAHEGSLLWDPSPSPNPGLPIIYGYYGFLRLTRTPEQCERCSA